MSPQDLIDRCEARITQRIQPHDISNAIASADHAARLAGLPTYSEIAQALRETTRMAVPQNGDEICKVRRAVTLTCCIPS